MENEEKYVGYISASKFKEGEMTGTLTWGKEKLKLRFFKTDGEYTKCEVARKTGKMAQTSTGVSYPEYVACGAVRYKPTETTGELVLDAIVDGIGGNHAFETELREGNDGGKYRILKFNTVSTNPYEKMFDTAPKVLSVRPEERTKDDPIPDFVPF